MSRSTLFAVGVIAAFGFGSGAMAWSPPVNHQAPSQSSQVSRQADKTDRPVIKPGDRLCLRDTGSLIPAKPGKCMAAIGRSYSAEDLRRTGAPDTASALRMLDPSIRIGH
ncbi:MAG: hypothetical protein ABI178_08070 [Rhodanobacter sp.]